MLSKKFTVMRTLQEKTEATYILWKKEHEAYETVNTTDVSTVPQN